MKIETLIGSLLLCLTTFVVPNIGVAANKLVGLNEDRCLNPMVDRYLWVRGEDPSIRALSLKERYRLVEKHYEFQVEKGFNFLNGPWDRALIPTLKAQRETVIQAAYLADSSLKTFKDIRSYLESGSERKLDNTLRVFVAQLGGKLRAPETLSEETQDSEYQKRATDEAAILAACAQFSPLNALSCAHAVKALRTDLRFNDNMILPAVWKRFLTTQRWRDGVRHGALAMLNRIESNQVGNVFSDLLSGFLKAGLIKTEAEEATWQTLALYGNGGANTGFRLLIFDLPKQSSQFVVGMSVVGTAISYLDFKQRGAGMNHYAYPTQMVGSCLSPKPYHFWLSAYLARSLRQKGYSSEVSQNAVFILAKGYQLNRDLNNAGGGAEKILSKPSDHPTNQVVRLDLTMAAAGAVFGSVDSTSAINPFSLSQGLSVLDAVRGNEREISSSLLQKWVTSDRARLLHAWEQMFRPNVSLEYFRAQQNKQ